MPVTIDRMLESSGTADKLRKHIEAAFAETNYPGDALLVYDNSGHHLECNEVAAAFRGKHWKEISLEILRYHSAGIVFLTPEAYRFYLPAYLLAAVMHYNQADTIPDSVVFSLIPPADANDFQAYQRRIEGFTPAQRQAIKYFLEYLKQTHPEDDVLGDLDKAIASF
jgi:hypothetical protein